MLLPREFNMAAAFTKLHMVILLGAKALDPHNVGLFGHWPLKSKT